MWNHWDNHDDRTNNRIEGYNTRMTNYCGASDPKIDKAVNLIKIQVRRLHREDALTLENYFTQIINIFQFIPKKRCR